MVQVSPCNNNKKVKYLLILVDNVSIDITVYIYIFVG